MGTVKVVWEPGRRPTTVHTPDVHVDILWIVSSAEHDLDHGTPLDDLV